MLILAVGNLGSGKTLLMTMNAQYEYLVKKRRIKANYNLANAEQININELVELELEDCLLNLDEIDTIIDSHNSMGSGTSLISNFIKQSRKKGVDIFATSQLSRMVELRFEQLVNRYFLCECLGNIKNPVGFNYHVYENQQLVNEFTINIEKAKPFFDMYETKQPIYPIKYFAENNIKIDDLKILYKDSPNKKTFVTLAKRQYPYFSLDNFNAIFDLIKTDNDKMLKKILGIREPKREKIGEI